MASIGKKTRTPRRSPDKKRLWRMVTNQHNLLYMLAAGMVTAPGGFAGDKYYEDLLDVEPGSVPLFRPDSLIPRAVVKRVTGSEDFLRPCIATFNLAGLDGLKVQRMLSKGGRKEVGLATSRKSKDELAVLVPLPLPMAWLEDIVFQTKAEQQGFEDLAADFANVSLAGIESRVEPDCFADDGADDWSAAQQRLSDNREGGFPAHPQAMGGVLAMLYHTANRSDLATATFRVASGQSDARDRSTIAEHPILELLPGWLEKGGAPESKELRIRLFWGVAEQLTSLHGADKDDGTMDVILSWLQKEQASSGDDRLAQLIDDMRGCFGLGGGTISDLFERHRGPLSRALLLLCLREDCISLLEFSHPLMKDIDHVAAAILFGIRDGWLRLPAALRTPRLAACTTTRMAALGHPGFAVAFQSQTPAPQPLRALFHRGASSWKTNQQQAALELAKARGWIDCVSTRIRLPSTAYAEKPQQEDAHLVFPGWLAADEPQVDMAAILDRLSGQPLLDPTTDSRIRKLLEQERG